MFSFVCHGWDAVNIELNIFTFCIYQNAMCVCLVLFIFIDCIPLMTNDWPSTFKRHFVKIKCSLLLIKFEIEL